MCAVFFVDICTRRRRRVSALRDSAAGISVDKARTQGACKDISKLAGYGSSVRVPETGDSAETVDVGKKYWGHLFSTLLTYRPSSAKSL